MVVTRRDLGKIMGVPELNAVHKHNKADLMPCVAVSAAQVYCTRANGGTARHVAVVFILNIALHTFPVKHHFLPWLQANTTSKQTNEICAA